jgi:hypothetical protein
MVAFQMALYSLYNALLLEGAIWDATQCVLQWGTRGFPFEMLLHARPSHQPYSA